MSSLTFARWRIEARVNRDSQCRATRIPADWTDCAAKDTRYAASMRIDFVITELNVGGAEKALTEIALGLAQRDHAVRVLSIGSKPSPGRDGLVHRLAAENVEVEFGGFDHWTAFQRASSWLRASLRARRPDVCQTFLFHANCLGAAAAHRAGVSRILGGLRVAESNWIRSMLERRAIAKMEKLVCVSTKVERFARTELRVPGDRCVVIPNGVDVSRYNQAQPYDWTQIEWPAESEVALFVGRLHPQKGLELIQEQATRLLDGKHRRLLFVGDGPLRVDLQRWAEGFGGRVRLLGFQPDPAPYLKASTMLLLPSHYEGMPNVVLEAMAAGLPVVCSRVEGSEELLRGSSEDPIDRQGYQGFEPGNSDQLARLAEQFFRDPDLRRVVGGANRNTVQRDFSIERMVDAYSELYESPATF